MKEATHKKLQTKLEKLKGTLEKLQDSVQEIQEVLEVACDNHNNKK